MICNFKKYIFLISCFLSAFTCFGQQETMLYFMKDMPQSLQLNPAHKSVYKTSIILPSVYLNAESTTFSYNNIFTEDLDGTNIDLEKFFEKLQDQNIMESTAVVDLVGLTITSDKISFSLFVRERISSVMQIKEDVGELFAKGTAHPDNLNKEFNVAPEFNLSHYREYGFGFNYNIKDRWTFGLNAKYLSGLMNISMKNAKITLQTEDAANYPITIAMGDAPIRTAGFNKLLTSDKEFTTAELGSYLAGGAGNGFAFDLGLTFQLTDRILLEFAATNIGQIIWSNSRQDYQLGAENYNTVVLTGSNPQDVFNSENFDEPNPQYDSLVKLFDFQELPSDGGTYTTTLPMYTNVAASINLGHKFIIGCTAGFSYLDGYFNPRASFSMNKRFADFLGIGVNYTADKSGISRFGGAVSIGFPGIKVYAISDDLVKNITNWKDSQSLGVRVGVNLNFGYVKQNYLNKKQTRSSQIMEWER
ncbi:DUF5723 family protein [Flammeovirga aprica]|uniref:DUF5723 domain-containing protein n=1 Tax=Flammeovirga aprica JL-4 TaxID=694437 RepID=A0A7X9P109_9BACT|nr:DUF5723 family protein [Flammeovirga aprica]NME67538.1 hypothetical protein [Flammeovirga aprica JL-4]